MNYFLKTLGTMGWPLNDFWIEDRTDLERLAFPKHRRPHIEPGDAVVIYATGHQRLIAAGRFTSEPRHDPSILIERHKWNPENAGRWPWVVEWKPSLIVPFASRGPHLTKAGISTLSVRSQSHIRIDEDVYRRALGLMAASAGIGDDVYIAAYGNALPAVDS